MIALALGAAAAAVPAAEPPAPIAGTVQGARLAGEGRLRWLGLAIYDARLWTAPGFSRRNFERHPFALELTYRRNLRGRDIAARSIEEMLRAEPGPVPPAWQRELQSLLPDVAPGDRITGVNRPGRGVAFLANGRELGEIQGEHFARRFFGLWLADSTPEPALREALLKDTAQ